MDRKLPYQGLPKGGVLSLCTEEESYSQDEVKTKPESECLGLVGAVVKCSSRSSRGWEENADLSWSEVLSLLIHSPGLVHTSAEESKRQRTTWARQGGSQGGEDKAGRRSDEREGLTLGP